MRHSRAWRRWPSIAWGPVLALLLGLLLAGCERPWAPAHTAVARGAEVYAQHCAKCHGPEGVGQDPTDPFGSADPARGFLAPALNGQGHCSSHTPGELVTLIRHGSSVPGSPMVGFEGRLSEPQVRDLVSFLYGLWPRAIQRLYEREHREELHRVIPREP